MRFVASIKILTHNFARADFLFWVLRKSLMPLVAVPGGASITIACGCASHTVLAAVFSDIGHVWDEHAVTVSISTAVMMLLAYDISYHQHHDLQRRISMLWKLYLGAALSRGDG